ncbi:BSD domain-containing protein [Striga hermonthica]|uniref:BSD domain-containing protein n=1 Tax=Striga hermonthica TaxID=68872 RepID=A0A9N7R1X3_STRHE|nr:BSD domain-containing protein [Striga hermonthica]
MDFFRSAFSDPSHAAAPDSPTSIPAAPQNPQTPSSSWAFGSTLFQTLASKSETLIDHCYKDFQEFSTGLKKETSVIRQAASRVVQDLPARLESGAAIAQESLEAVGQAIDNVGSTVSEIIGTDLNSDGSTSAQSVEGERDLNSTREAKPYNRMEAVIRALQCDIRTYCDEVEGNDYLQWRTGFKMEDKRGEIEHLVKENGIIVELYNEIVPLKVDEKTFWCRYFYRADKLIKAEEERARIVKKVILGEEEEELSWDFDDDDDDDDSNCNNENGDCNSKDGLEKGKVVDNAEVETREIVGVGSSGTKSDEIVDEENLREKLIDSEKELSDGKLGSDISIISSQQSSHAEDDLGWDEIEDIGNGDGNTMSKSVDLHKRLNSAEKEDEEELTWDVDDDDDECEPVK